MPDIPPIFGLPCWLFLQKHRWGSWSYSVAHFNYYKVCHACPAIRWRKYMPQVDRSHPTHIPLNDDGRPWQASAPGAMKKPETNRNQRLLNVQQQQASAVARRRRRFPWGVFYGRPQ